MVGVNALYEGGHLPKPVAGKLTWRPSALDLVQVCGVGLVLHTACSDCLAYIAVQQAHNYGVGLILVAFKQLFSLLSLLSYSIVVWEDITSACSMLRLLVKIRRHMLLDFSSAATLLATCHAEELRCLP